MSKGLLINPGLYCVPQGNRRRDAKDAKIRAKYLLTVLCFDPGFQIDRGGFESERAETGIMNKREVFFVALFHLCELHGQRPGA